MEFQKMQLIKTSQDRVDEVYLQTRIPKETPLLTVVTFCSLLGKVSFDLNKNFAQGGTKNLI